MEYEYSDIFIKDIKSFERDKEFAQQLAGKIKEIKKANSIEDIPGLEEIRGRKVFYRFKIKTRKTTYRIGIKVLHTVVWLTLIDNAKKRFYKRI